MSFTTSDLYDANEQTVQVAEPLFRSYGGAARFSGSVVTIKVFEDNSLVRAALEELGEGQVLVVDGGGSMRCALIGDQLAALAQKNGWAGIIVFGCIRDSVQIGKINIGVKALNTNPRKSIKRGLGDRNIPVTFAGVTFSPGDYVYADEDGLLLGTTELS